MKSALSLPAEILQTTGIQSTINLIIDHNETDYQKTIKNKIWPRKNTDRVEICKNNQSYKTGVGKEKLPTFSGRVVQYQKVSKCKFYLLEKNLTN